MDSLSGLTGSLRLPRFRVFFLLVLAKKRLPIPEYILVCSKNFYMTGPSWSKIFFSPIKFFSKFFEIILTLGKMILNVFLFIRGTQRNKTKGDFRLKIKRTRTWKKKKDLCPERRGSGSYWFSVEIDMVCVCRCVCVYVKEGKGTCNPLSGHLAISPFSTEWFKDSFPFFPPRPFGKEIKLQVNCRFYTFGILLQPDGFVLHSGTSPLVCLIFHHLEFIFFFILKRSAW